MSSAGRVGGGNEHDLLPQIGPHGDDRAGLEFSVDGMREKDHEVQFTIGGIRACWIRGDNTEQRSAVATNVRWHRLVLRVVIRVIF